MDSVLLPFDDPATTMRPGMLRLRVWEVFVVICIVGVIISIIVGR